MTAAAAMKIDASRILTRSEIKAVIADLKRKGKRSVNSRMNLVVFRLAVCCGLRASEIVGLKLANARVQIAKPHIYVPKAIAKGKKFRRVPLWWDALTLADVTAWKAERQAQGAAAGDFFICTQSKSAFGGAVHRNGLRRRFISACGVLGKPRQQCITIHDGRHSFVSHALKGRSLAEVQQAAGHANVSTTSIYLHIAVEDDGAVGNLFDFDAGL